MSLGKGKVGMQTDVLVKKLAGYPDFRLASKGTVRECSEENTPKSPRLADWDALLHQQ